jgi:thiol:disulfide interchange protein DsbC
MTNAKAGGEIEPASCENPIEQHMALAERVGLRGTPLIYTDSGEKVPGYREAAALASMVKSTDPITN